MSQQPSLASSGLGALTPADAWRIVRKHLWLILACFVVVGLGGTAGLLAWYYVAPSYTTQGIIEIESGGQAFPLTQGYQTEVPITLFRQYIESQVLTIQSERVLGAAIEKLKAERPLSSQYASTYGLGRILDVRYMTGTQNILVELTGRQKDEIQAVVREVLSQYIERIRADRTEADAERQRELRVERDELRNQLVELGNQLSRLRTETNVVVSDDRYGEQLGRLGEVARRLTAAQVELAEANTAWTQFQELRKQMEETKDSTLLLMAFPEVLTAVNENVLVQAMNAQLADLGQQLQGLKQRFGQKHETVRRLEKSYQALQNDLEVRQSEVLGQAFQRQAALLKNRYDQARAAEADLLERVAEARSAAVSSAKLSAEYRAREAEFARVQALSNTINDGLERLRISAALARPNIRVTRWPMIPIEPSEPRVMIYVPATLLFSLLLGLGLSLAIELLDTRLRTPAEMVRHVGISLLGAIPDLTEDERLSLDTNLALVSQTMPQSLMAEAYRHVRTSLRFVSDYPIRSVLVTSPHPGDGKTTVAANLAIAMARSGVRTLLVEANFRRPCLGRLFDVPEAVGLSNLLVGLNQPSEVVQATSVENLDLLVGGPPPPSPAELLGSATMQQLMKTLSATYEHIIIDGAPVLVVADNHLLAERLDGVILVFRAGDHTRGLAQRATRQVLALRARLLGGILNRTRATKGGYFRKAYQAYYDYSAVAQAGAEPAVAGEPKAGPDGAGGSAKG